VALFNGPAIPSNRFGVVLLHAFAGSAHSAEFELRISVTPFSGVEVPLSRLEVVYFLPADLVSFLTVMESVIVCVTDFDLGLGITRLRKLTYL
jgi:hypothetical protein